MRVQIGLVESVIPFSFICVSIGNNLRTRGQPIINNY
jgi:hypothetical protein